MSGSDFWPFLFKSTGVDVRAGALEAAHDEWLAQRLVRAFPINEGIPEILSAARAAGLRQAVVSNNPQDEVVRILANSGLLDRFDVVAGNDGYGRAKKPAPGQLPVRGQGARAGGGQMRRRGGFRARPPCRPRLRGVRGGGRHGGGVLRDAPGIGLGRCVLRALRARRCVPGLAEQTNYWLNLFTGRQNYALTARESILDGKDRIAILRGSPASTATSFGGAWPTGHQGSRPTGCGPCYFMVIVHV